MRPLMLAAVALATLAGCADDETGIDSVSVTDLPASAAAGSTVEVCWHVDGSGSIGHTAVHWDTASHGADATFQDYAGGLAFPGNENTGPWDLPGDFCADLTMPESDMYLRGHAMVEAPGIVSAEQRVALA